MDLLLDFANSFVTQLRSPTLAFLIGGALLAALGSKLTVPDAIYQFIIFVLLMSIGLHGGMEIRDADLAALALPALMATLTGVVCVLLGWLTLARLPGIRFDDAIATSGLFGAVSASTLAAAIVVMQQENVAYEAWAPALYPFMDIPALVLAIVMASLHKQKAKAREAAAAGGEVVAVKRERVKVGKIVKDSLRGSALSALILGLAIGLLAEPGRVYEEFYEPLFRGFLSILLLIMGMEAYSRLSELRGVAHWFAVYALIAPIAHGLIGFGLGYVAHVLVGFSPGGVVILAIIAASNSDISGPPTLRAGIPSANPASFIGSSTSIGTPIAIAVCIPLFLALGEMVFGAT
ncbi:sodium-dependent bicarbonate transport family permease [uncultured Algimonas sp.]|uniref:sodium-dependent bicarbonate transport family permease n=1 Tax=uncultured Algimonas sp. TaxID=1547920 RepID=UPI00261D6DF0|nr:sodium-dependent bicarbonate transport family permease [uncultured Algimonas sp.]